MPELERYDIFVDTEVGLDEERSDEGEWVRHTDPELQRLILCGVFHARYLDWATAQHPGSREQCNDAFEAMTDACMAAKSSPSPPYRQDYLGCLATCSQGRRGVITGYERLPWGWAYVGVGLDGTQWSSRNPTDVAEAPPPAKRPPAQPNGERT